MAGTFTVDDSFCITGRGLVLVGSFSGWIAPGYVLVFDDVQWRIKGVDFVNLDNRQEKLGLWVDTHPATYQELMQRGIIGATAQLVAP